MTGVDMRVADHVHFTMLSLGSSQIDRTQGAVAGPAASAGTGAGEEYSPA
jgi:hypothetical protein